MIKDTRYSSGTTLGSLCCALIAIVLLVTFAIASDGVSEGDTEPTISVGRMLFCRSVKEREPEDTAAEFPNDIEKVYCFTVIVNAGPEETHVVHKWYWGETLMGSVQLKAQGEYWRTWSLKHMQPEWTGTWRVDVVSADGKILKSASFELVVPGAGSGATEDDAEGGETDGDSGGDAGGSGLSNADSGPAEDAQ